MNERVPGVSGVRACDGWEGGRLVNNGRDDTAGRSHFPLVLVRRVIWNDFFWTLDLDIERVSELTF